jgi:outer membrane autotransporter protein
MNVMLNTLKATTALGRILCIGLPAALGIMGALSHGAEAACTASADNLTQTCGGSLSAPITVYDVAASTQPVNGSNSYTPTSYSQTPATVTLNFGNTTSFNVTTNATSGLADKGLVAANFSNAEDPAVNNVQINNAGAIALSTGQISTSRMHAIVADSQVNLFTVSNQATGTISATQTFGWGGGFNAANLSNVYSASAKTNSAKYSGSTLNVVSALYSDDNTNSFVLNNAGTVTAVGNFAAAYYGRADTQITNSGTLQNSSWISSDHSYAGHWAVAAFAGADFDTVAGSNPDTPLYNVTNIVSGQGNVKVLDTSSLALTNTGTIKGDILAIDTNPLSWAAAQAGNVNPATISGSGSNSGPRDSAIVNSGTINGNIYLGSGSHSLTNSGTIAGGISVDQRASLGAFAVGVAGTSAGTYQSAGGTSLGGTACATAGQNTSDPSCAATTPTLASFYGSRSFSLTNSGTLGGNISINDQAGAVNTVQLSGSGFTGNVIAANGTGSNTLILGPGSSIGAVSGFGTIKTSLSGSGGTLAAPSTNGGRMASLDATLTGGTAIDPVLSTVVKNGDVYKLANSLTGGIGSVSVANTSLISWTPSVDAAAGNALVMTASVNLPSAVATSGDGDRALSSLLGYAGANAKLNALGVTVQNLTSAADVAKAAEQLRPSVNNSAAQAAAGVTTAMQNVVETRLASTGTTGISTGDQPQGLGVWAQGLGYRGVQGRRLGVDGYSANTSGLAAGIDSQADEAGRWRIGAALSDGVTQLADNGVNQGNTTHVDSYQVMGYGAYQPSDWYTNASIGVAMHRYNTVRQINFGGLVDAPTASHDARQYSAKLDSGYNLAMGGGTFTPVASLAYSRLNQDAYTESGRTAAALGVGSSSTNSLRLGLGGKMAYELTKPSGDDYGIGLEGRAVYFHEFIDTAQQTTAQFAVGGSSFTTTGVTPAVNAVAVGFSLKVASVNQQSLLLSYDGEFKDQYAGHTVTARLRTDF